LSAYPLVLHGDQMRDLVVGAGAVAARKISDSTAVNRDVAHDARLLGGANWR
jgi:hypothetical protein